jgi:hypothetical protein
MMPVLYGCFPAPRGHHAGPKSDTGVEGTNYSQRFVHYCPWHEEMPEHHEGRS